MLLLGGPDSHFKVRSGGNRIGKAPTTILSSTAYVDFPRLRRRAKEITKSGSGKNTPASKSGGLATAILTAASPVVLKLSLLGTGLLRV